MWTTKQIADVLKAEPVEHESTIKRFIIDTRHIKEGDCFLALRGARDGHDYIQEAYAKGASCVIGEHSADFNVPNTQGAVELLGQYAKAKSPAKRIAITGSVGKTTTKHFLYEALRQHKHVIASEQSFNNHLGVPLTLTRLREDTEVGIFEVGTNHPGEILELGNQVEPHIAIITKIGHAHIGHFGNTVDGIAKEKSALLDTLVSGGVGIVPADDDFMDLYKGKGKKLITFGEGGDIELLRLEHQTVHIRVFGREIMFKVPFIAEHLINNTLIVWAVCHALGIEHFDTEKLTPLKGRGMVHQVPSGNGSVTVIDEAYNAPYEGMRGAIENMAKHFAGRKILVLGDFGETGECSEQFHQDIADLAKKLKIQKVICCGPMMAKAFNQPCLASEDALQLLRDTMKAGDVVLLKGSNASGVFKIVEKLVH